MCSGSSDRVNGDAGNPGHLDTQTAHQEMHVGASALDTCMFELPPAGVMGSLDSEPECQPFN
jgi:hypothetical protein